MRSYLQSGLTTTVPSLLSLASMDLLHQQLSQKQRRVGALLTWIQAKWLEVNDSVLTINAAHFWLVVTLSWAIHNYCMRNTRENFKPHSQIH